MRRRDAMAVLVSTLAAGAAGGTLSFSESPMESLSIRLDGGSLVVEWGSRHATIGLDELMDALELPA